MRFTIIGGGAMGCLHGAHLAHAGHDVTFVDIRPEVVAAINRNGVHLDGVGGQFNVKVTATAPDSARGTADVVCVHTDTRGTSVAARLAANLVGQDGYAITFQNGIGNVETLVEVLGSQRVLGGVSYNSATSTGPGCVTHTAARTSWIGELQAADTPRASLLAETLTGAGLPTSVSPSIISVIWSKFVINCAINPIAALTGLVGHQIAANPAASALQDRLLDELLAFVKAKGVELSDDDPAATVKGMCRDASGKPSMLQHVEAGRPTEIDALNGAVVRQGRVLGIATCFNEAVTLMVKARSAGSTRDL